MHEANPTFGILLVDDEQPWLRSIRMILEGGGGYTNLQGCQDSREVLPLLAQGGIGLVLLDLTMPYLSGEELLGRIVEEFPSVTVIVVSGLNQLETAVHCMRLGAFDYIVKTDEEERILDGVRRAVRVQELEQENQALRRSLAGEVVTRPEAFADIVSDSHGMKSLFAYVESVAKTNQPLLITGESGTGKELFARAAHLLSGRSGPLVAVNVAGLDDTVFADTLFGHVRGAYTGADTPRGGMVERAADGTLFLDEIGDLSPQSQVKLLRLLQEGEYYPLGSDTPRQMQARVIVATHQDLVAKQQEGGFRRDLYYRLRAHHVQIPPLRERREDIPLLLNHFLDRAAAMLDKKRPTPPRELVTLLATYSFPGNVRELESMVFDAVSAHSGGVLSMEAFLRAMGGALPAALASTTPFADCEQLPTLSEAAELLVDEAIKRAGGNQTIAARLLGISQPALNKRIRSRS